MLSTSLQGTKRRRLTDALCRAAALLVFVTSACGEPAGPSRSFGGSSAAGDAKPIAADARALLEMAREATLAARSVEYDFEFAQEGAAVGWATGHTLLQQRTELADSLVRVEGAAQLGPGAPLETFAYATNGLQTWQRIDGEERVETAAADSGGRSLGGLAVYGVLPEFVESAPFWKELESSQSLRRLESRKIGGVLCHVVEVVWDEEALGLGKTRYEWYLGQDDLLPRGMHWSDPSTPIEGYDFLLSNLRRTAELPEDRFRLDVPDGWAVTETAVTVAPGLASPDWQLETSRGEAVRLSDLRGRVVVLDFWNTWCFICRNLQPSMAAIHRDYADRAVTVLGLNVFEVDDPADYWQRVQPGYDYLVEADAVAQLYDVPWQPAVVVVDPQGRVVLNLLGGSADREQQIRAAVDAGLEPLETEG